MSKRDVRSQEPVVAPSMSSEDTECANVPAVGREFGSPDFDRLLALDDAAFAVFQTWELVRHWLDSPNVQLGGLRPEDAARTPEGYHNVLALLTKGGQRQVDAVRAA